MLASSLLAPAVLLAAAPALPQLDAVDVLPSSSTSATAPLGDLAAVDGRRAIVVPERDGTVPAAPGSLTVLFLEQDAAGTWAEAQAIDLPSIAATAGPGSIAIEGDFAAVALGVPSNRAEVSVFHRDPASGWSLFQTIATGSYVPQFAFDLAVAFDSGELLAQDITVGALRSFRRTGGTGLFIEGTSLSLAPVPGALLQHLAVEDGLAFLHYGNPIEVWERGAAGGWQPTGGVAIPPPMPGFPTRFVRSLATNGATLAFTLSNAPGSGDTSLFMAERTDPLQPGTWDLTGEWNYSDLGGVYVSVQPLNAEDLAFHGGSLHFTTQGACGTGTFGRSVGEIRRVSPTGGWQIQPGHCSLPLTSSESLRALSFDGQTLLLGDPEAAPGSAGAVPGALVFAPVWLTGEDCDLNGLRDFDERIADPTLDLNGDGRLDVCDTRGIPFCSTAVPNSTGLVGRLSARGIPRSNGPAVVLHASGLPVGSMGLLMSGELGSGAIALPGMSVGVRCIGGSSFGRFEGQPRVSDSGGTFDVLVDASDIPTGTGRITLTPGTRWHFQAWYIDGAVSNTTDAIQLRFE